MPTNTFNKSIRTLILAEEMLERGEIPSYLGSNTLEDAWATITKLWHRLDEAYMAEIEQGRTRSRRRAKRRSRKQRNKR